MFMQGRLVDYIPPKPKDEQKKTVILGDSKAL